MGIMDKVKAQAEQAMAKAQQGVSQGQAKLDTMQTKKAGDALLRDLGAAFYAEQRTGGSRDAVSAALSALDAHVAAHGPLDFTPSPDPTTGAVSFQPAPQQGAAMPPSSPDTAAAPVAGASFNLDDM